MNSISNKVDENMYSYKNLLVIKLTGKGVSELYANKHPFIFLIENSSYDNIIYGIQDSVINSLYETT